MKPVHKFIKLLTFLIEKLEIGTAYKWRHIENISSFCDSLFKTNCFACLKRFTVQYLMLHILVHFNIHTQIAFLLILNSNCICLLFYNISILNNKHFSTENNHISLFENFTPLSLFKPHHCITKLFSLEHQRSPSGLKGYLPHPILTIILSH